MRKTMKKIAALALMLAGCATVSLPSTPIVISDVKTLAGVYDGYAYGRFWTLTIQADGSYISDATMKSGPSRITGRIWRVPAHEDRGLVIPDQVRYESNSPAKGIVTLIERAGKRVLIFTRDDGARAEVTAH